jgi:Kef-type K+ transport system membrane component KefB
MHALDPSQPPAPRPATPRGSRGSRKRALIVGCGAFLLFGGWALIANRAHPVSDMARAAAAQGSLSFVSTTFSVLLLEYLYRLGRTPGQKLVLAAAGTPVIVLAIMTGVHALAGTPNIVITLLPSWISGTIFCVVYTLNLRRLELAGAAAEPPSPGR